MNPLRGVMNWISGMIAVVALVSIIVGILLVNDMAEFRKQFYEKGSVIYLDIDHRIESGFIVENAREEATFNPVPLSELYDVTESYIDEQYAPILKGTSKVFVFTEKAFDEAKFARVDAYHIEKDNVLALLKSHELLDDFPTVTGLPVEKVFGSGKNADDLRWKLFARLVFTQVEDKGPIFLLHGIRRGTVKVYPKTISFYVLPLLPESIIDWLASPERLERIKEVKNDSLR